MAEIIGLTASLITLAGVGAKLAKTLRDAADVLHSADHEARLMAGDISIFSSSLVQLSKTLPMISNLDMPEAGRLREIIEVLILACSSLIDELQKYIGDQMAFRTKGALWMRALGWHFRWFFQRPKIAFIRTLMESFKSTLIFLVSTMDLAVVIHQDAQHEVKESLKLQVETNLQFAEDAKANLLQYEEPQSEDQSQTLVNDLKSTPTSADPSLNSVPTLEFPSQSLVPYEQDKPTLGDHLPLSQTGHEDESVLVACLKDCPPELVCILKVQESTLEVAESLLKITPVPAFSWALPGATQGPRQTSHGRGSLDHDFSSTGNTRIAAGKLGSALPKSKNLDASYDLPEKSPTVNDKPQVIDPLQFLDANESLAQSKIDRVEDGVVDLQRLIRRIMEETLSAPKDEASTTRKPEPVKPLESSEPEIAFSDSYTTKSTLSGPSSGQFAQFAGSPLPPSKQPSLSTSKPDEFLALGGSGASTAATNQDGSERLTKLERVMLAERDEMIRQNALKAEHETAARVLLAANAARQEAETKASEEAEASRRAYEKALLEARAAQEELEKAKRVAEQEAEMLKPLDSPKPPIRFKDAVGRTFSFPWHLCKSWGGMEELIKQAFLHVDVIGPQVHDGHYDLVGPDREIILPQVWETTVQPGWSITMHMWPMPEPPEEILTKKDTSIKSSKLKEQFGKIFERRSVMQDHGRS